MSERGARGQIAAAMGLLVLLAAFSEGWVSAAIARVRSLTAGGDYVLPGVAGKSGFGPDAGAGQGAGGGGGGSF